MKQKALCVVIISVVIQPLCSGTHAGEPKLATPKPFYYVGNYNLDKRSQSEQVVRLGLPAAAIAWTSDVWNVHKTDWRTYRWDDPGTHFMPNDYPRLQRRVDKAAALNGSSADQTLLVLDIEHVLAGYGQKGPSARKEARVGRDYLRNVVLAVKANVTCKGVGLFRIVPEKYHKIQTYNRPSLLASNREFEFGLDSKGNQLENEGLADAVDFIAPWCYFPWDFDSKSMVKRIRLTCQESRRYGKPVYPFIWPRWHHGSPDKNYAGKEVPLTEMYHVFRACEEYADGAFFWTDDEPFRADMQWVTAWHAFQISRQ